MIVAATDELDDLLQMDSEFDGSPRNWLAPLQAEYLPKPRGRRRARKRRGVAVALRQELRRCKADSARELRRSKVSRARLVKNYRKYLRLRSALRRLVAA